MSKSSFASCYSQYFGFYTEKVQEKGEDAYLLCTNQSGAIFAVMDGCGGIGSRIYPEFEGKTGAYLASRAAASGLMKWYLDHNSNHRDIEEIKNVIVSSLEAYNSKTETIRTIKGSMQKEFPTTLAGGIAFMDHDDYLAVQIFWCGDSRMFSLDDEGLKQWSSDDVYGQDAMSNIHNDGVLTNVISLSVPFEIHSRLLYPDRPQFMFSATDGCYEYLPSPMHFEYLLLDCLMKAKNQLSWEETVKDRLSEVAADDCSISGILVGFQTFQELKNFFYNRYIHLREQYIEPFTNTDTAGKNALWSKYRIQYEKMNRSDNG